MCKHYGEKTIILIDEYDVPLDKAFQKGYYDECFGFTDTEVKKILSDYNLSDHYLQIREWYDGYRFGNTDIYCPWDVIRYCKSLCADPDALPEDFWSNSSGNEIVRRFIDKADI